VNGRWVAACAGAEAIGMTAAAAAARIATGLEDEAVAWGLAVVVLGGLVEGAALGLLQARALPAGLGPTPRRRWLIATVAVAGLGWAAASAPSALAGDDAGSPPPWIVVAAGAAALGVLMGAVLGLAQGWSVRRSVSHPWRWVPASMLGWACAMPVIFAGASSAGADWALPSVALFGAATGALAGTVLGVVTGRFAARDLGPLDAGPVAMGARVA
jgi:hypothetical protein